MSKHNFNFYAAQEYGQVDSRYDSGNGRFMQSGRRAEHPERTREERRDRMEQRTLQKKMQRDARRLID